MPLWIATIGEAQQNKTIQHLDSEPVRLAALPPYPNWLEVFYYWLDTKYGSTMPNRREYRGEHGGVRARAVPDNRLSGEQFLSRYTYFEMWY